MLDNASILRKLLKNLFLTEDGCYEWTGSVGTDGYGLMSVEGKTRRVHRVAASVFFGMDLRSDLLVLHHCDNTRCWNPDHLWLGTNDDNMQDRNLKRRARGTQGVAHHAAKLTEGDVLDIRRRFAAGQKQAEIADALGLKRGLVNDIVHRKTWKHI